MQSDQVLLHQLAEFLGGKPSCTPWEPPLRKLGRKMEDTIRNFSEVKHACEKYGLTGYLQ